MVKEMLKGAVIAAAVGSLFASGAAQACEATPAVPAESSGAELLRALGGARAAVPVVDERGFVIGVLPVRAAREALAGSAARTAGELARTAGLVLLLPDDDLQHALHVLSESGTSEAVVVESPDAPRPLGIVTREGILDAWHRANT